MTDDTLLGCGTTSDIGVNYYSGAGGDLRNEILIAPSRRLIIPINTVIPL